MGTNPVICRELLRRRSTEAIDRSLGLLRGIDGLVEWGAAPARPEDTAKEK
jgi:hypothetical protein